MIVLANRRDGLKVENEFKLKWAFGVLQKMGVPVETPEEPTMADLRDAKNLIRDTEIDIINDNDNGLMIFYQGKLIAQWLRPNYKLKEDPKQIDPDKRYYLEINLNFYDYLTESEEENQDGN